METQITVYEFFDVWCTVIEKNHQGRLLKPMEYWYNRPNKTAFIENEIYPALADSFNFKYSAPYYFIDSVFYRHDNSGSTDKVPNTPENVTYLRKIRIGLEHENVFDYKLYQELSHLLLVNCDIKVVVSYPNNYSIHEVFEELSNTISNHDSLNVMNESILLILGKREIDGDEIFWEGYTNKGGKWESFKKHSIGRLKKEF